MSVSTTPQAGATLPVAAAQIQGQIKASRAARVRRGYSRVGGDRLDSSPRGRVLIYILLVAGSIIFLSPLVYLVGGSLKSAADLSNGSLNPVPTPPLWGNYPQAMRQLDPTQIDATKPLRYPLPLANTVVITVLTVMGQIISSSLVGFGFARFRFRGRGPLFAIMLSTMMLPAQITIVPLFVMFRYVGWIDTFWPLIVPAWVGQPLFIFMFRQFFLQIPEELVEAARLDGASNWTIYAKLMMPLCGPVIAIVAIYTFMWTWNDFMNPLIYLNSPENRTLALALNSFKGEFGATQPQLLLAASTLTMLPCVVLFFALQKHFVESVAMTGLK
jgi:ABC-type glycerol-3-phosphate transport system permease component